LTGNKRTSFATAELVLSLNAYFIEAKDEEAIEFLLLVARKNVDLKQIISWIRNRLKRRDEDRVSR